VSVLRECGFIVYEMLCFRIGSAIHDFVEYGRWTNERIKVRIRWKPGRRSRMKPLARWSTQEMARSVDVSRMEVVVKDDDDFKYEAVAHLEPLLVCDLLVPLPTRVTVSRVYAINLPRAQARRATQTG